MQRAVRLENAELNTIWGGEALALLKSMAQFPQCNPDPAQSFPEAALVLEFSVTPCREAFVSLWKAFSFTSSIVVWLLESRQEATEERSPFIFRYI